MRNVKSVSLLAPDGTEGGKLLFVPDDKAMQIRAKNAQGRFMALTMSLAGQRLTTDGRGVDGPSAARVGEIEKQYMELVDAVCGVSGSAQEAFKRYRPFASMPDGTFWAETVINTIVSVI